MSLDESLHDADNLNKVITTDSANIVQDSIDPNNQKEPPIKRETHDENGDPTTSEVIDYETTIDIHSESYNNYAAMSLEQLTEALQKLLKTPKIQSLKSEVETIKNEFNTKYETLVDQKREVFIEEGGEAIDFLYKNPIKKEFKSVYNKYKDLLNAHYKQVEHQLKQNLATRLQIIEDLKGLMNKEEHINTTYKSFKEIQERWKNGGPIPRDNYNIVWNTYRHHVEIFYDYLDLNRELRDLDFKHNLKQKLKLIDRAESLLNEDNVNKSFRELQTLHKLWKEDIGPVDKANRESVWERFSKASKAIHDKRQAYYSDLDKAYHQNLKYREEIIAEIEAKTRNNNSSHKLWQQNIKAVESLRNDFLNTGKVPHNHKETIWNKFKASLKAFHKAKNHFYKTIKEEQSENLQKKLELIAIAEKHKESTDFEKVTPIIKKIQNDWKKIGQVPPKNSDKVWKKFKSACNQYFDKVHAERQAAKDKLTEAFRQKADLLAEFKNTTTSDIKTIKERIAQWKTIGRVPYEKRKIEEEFNSYLDCAFNALKIDKLEKEMLKYDNRLEAISNPEDKELLDNEKHFVRKKITELNNEINQLENNIQFFSNADENNPLVKNVYKKLNIHKSNLNIWKEKLKKVNQMK